MHPSNFRTDSFSSGVFKGGKLSAVFLMSLILAVIERSSGCNRLSGDGDSSMPLANVSTLDSRTFSCSDTPPSKEDFYCIDRVES